MYNLTKIDSSFPIVGRTIGRDLCSAINYMVLGLAQNIVRKNLQDTVTSSDDPTEEARQSYVHKHGTVGGVDAHNTAIAAAMERAESERNLGEQGHTQYMEQIALGGLLLTIRNTTAQHLEEKASFTESILTPGVMLPNPYDVAQTIEEAFKSQLQRAPRVPDATLKAEMKAHGFSEERVLELLKSRNNTQVEFLKKNENLMFEEIDKMLDKVYVGEDEFYAAYDKLPAIYKLRLLVAVDTGLFRQAEREFTSYIDRNRTAGKEASAILQASRIEVRKMIVLLEKDPAAARQLREDVDRGAALPKMQPLPENVQQLLDAWIKDGCKEEKAA